MPMACFAAARASGAPVEAEAARLEFTTIL